MNNQKTVFLEQMIRELCLARHLDDWLTDRSKLSVCLVLICLSGAIYGATLGIWRDPLQAMYVAIKFPLLLLLTALGTSLINTMLAQLLRVPIDFFQCFLAVLMSFALLAVLLAAFTPLVAFLLWHLPEMNTNQQDVAHRIFLLANVVLIAFSGTMANIQLRELLKQICPEVADKILAIWLSMNLFLGAQLSWNLRPFFGAPDLPVTFLREHPFDGSFYETVFSFVQESFL